MGEDLMLLSCHASTSGSTVSQDSVTEAGVWYDDNGAQVAEGGGVGVFCDGGDERFQVDWHQDC